MEKKMVSTTDRMKWSGLLIEAVEKPGLISEAFHAFHGYSLGNRIFALEQCRARGITPVHSRPTEDGRKKDGKCERERRELSCAGPSPAAARVSKGRRR
jgi:hypothetical protein